ncbi:MAG: mannosyltransferase family protein [Chloroflexota bacterium]
MTRALHPRRAPGLPGTGAGPRTAGWRARPAALADRLRTIHFTFLGVEVDARMLASILTAFVVTKVMIAAIIFVSSVALPMAEGSGHLFWNPANLVLDGLVRDDSWWYATIAHNGYTMGDLATDAQGSVAFFPLYPLLTRIVAIGTGSVFPAGLIVSNLAFLLGLGYVYALARHEFEDRTASRAVFYVAAAPTAIFFMAMYTESLFLLVTAATFYYARTGRWLGAAIAGALAAATRNTGATLALVVALEALRQAGFRWRPPLHPAEWGEHLGRDLRAVRGALPGLIAAAIVPLGLVAYMAYLAISFGDPLGFIHVQATWGRDVTGIGLAGLWDDTLRTLHLGAQPLAGQVSSKTLMDVVATIGAVGLVLAVLRKLPATYGAYLLLAILIPLSTGSVGSMTRYILMLWPAMLVVGRWGRHGAVDRTVLAIFLPLSAYFAILFSHWVFAG